jgi:predicted ATPase
MPYLNVGSQGEYTTQVLSQKKYPVPEDRCIDSSQPYELLAQARAWMNFIVPGVSIDDVQLFGKIKAAEISYFKSSPTNVGFGVSYVLPIVVSGLIAQEESLLVIENPEAHLHPSGQSRIGQFLARIAAAGVQVLVETHSEHVINGIRLATLTNTPSPDEVLVNFFSRNNEGKSDVTVIRFTSKGDLEQWPLGFFDQQQQDFAHMIRLKKQVR